jgi:hypothetical protein
MARVMEIVQTMALFSTWKCAASESSRKMTTKKSKASRTQPRMPEVTANCQPGALCSFCDSDRTSMRLLLHFELCGIVRGDWGGFYRGCEIPSSSVQMICTLTMVDSSLSISADAMLYRK